MDERKRGRLHTFDDAESKRDTFDKMGLTRTEIAGEREDPAGLRLAAPLLAERDGSFRTL
jgi:hypothetical protein